MAAAFTSYLLRQRDFRLRIIGRNCQFADGNPALLERINTVGHAAKGQTELLADGLAADHLAAAVAPVGQDIVEPAAVSG